MQSRQGGEVYAFEREARSGSSSGSGSLTDLILGAGSAIAEVRAQLQRVVPFASVPLLVTGETGTGKDLIARALHALGPGASRGQLVCVNCAALPENLIESELFGHEDGAFTGAAGARTGLLEEAADGIVFLDEITEMPLSCQAKLLRALEERAFRRVGANRLIPLSARIVSATNQPVAQLTGGRLRADLYYRLAGFTIHLPPLRDRREDIPTIATHFLDEFRARYDRGPASIHPAAMRLLQEHSWPGNVRELRCVVEHAAIVCHDDILDTPCFEMALRARPACPTPCAAAKSCGIDSVPSLRDVERAAIERALEQCRGNISWAARVLKIPRSTLRDRLRRYGIVTSD